MKRINIAKARMEWIQVLEDAGEAPVLKRLHVRIHHSTHPPFKLILCPNTKVSDVLAYLNLPKEDYIIYPVSDPARTLYPEEDLYAAVEDNAKLIVLSSYDAARILFKKLFPISSHLTEGMKK